MLKGQLIYVAEERWRKVSVTLVAVPFLLFEIIWPIWSCIFLRFYFYFVVSHVFLNYDAAKVSADCYTSLVLASEHACQGRDKCKETGV